MIKHQLTRAAKDMGKEEEEDDDSESFEKHFPKNISTCALDTELVQNIMSEFVLYIVESNLSAFMEN